MRQSGGSSFPPASHECWNENNRHGHHFSNDTAALTMYKESKMVNRMNRERYIGITVKRWKHLSFGLAIILLFDLTLRIASQYKTWRRSGRCSISLGTYLGEEYRNKKQTVGASTCLLESKWMKVQQQSVKLPGQSQVIHDWLIIDYHDRVNVLVEDEAQPGKERRFLVFEQSKYTLDSRVSLAVVGGIVEPGEEPQVAARREVEEEMGMDCSEFHFLGRYRTDVNRGMGWVNSFLATQCGRRKGIASQPNGAAAEEVGAVDSEKQDLRSITLQELRDAATEGKFLEVQWSNTVSLALLHPELITSQHK